MEEPIDSPQSPDRLGQVLSGSAVQQGAGDSALQVADSNPGPVDQAQTGISVAEIVFENQRQHSSVTSEGVASAGHTFAAACDRMGEFVPVAPSTLTAGFEGETSGGGEDAAANGGSTAFDGDGSAKPMDIQAAASTQHAVDAPSHVGGGKRKSYIDDSQMESKRTEGLQRMPSDLAMVMGDSDYIVPPAPDACDSNAAVGSAGDGGPLGAQGESMVNLADRPTDADIIAWENKIREEEIGHALLIGDVEAMDALEAEYATGSEVFKAKIASLKSAYGSIRRTRGDGNCFFRSFAFAFLEHLLLTGDASERDRAVAQLEVLKKQLMDAGYDELVLESPLDILLGMLRSINSLVDPLTIQILEVNMRDDNVSNYIVFLLRMITAAEVKRRDDFFAPFIIGLSGMDTDTFCSRCIDPMGEESDHVQLVALTEALKVPIRVVYLDRSMAPDGGAAGGESVHVDMHDFIPEGCQPEPRVHLLYRPGHYDVLYPKA